jgi:3-oxoacyl-[acyl-carrier-protein] synthase II
MAVAQALAEAGVQAGAEPLDDIGLVMSDVLGPSGAVESYLEALAAKGPRSSRPAHFVDTLLSMPASRVGIALKLRGSTAVLGGASPFELALGWLRHGREHTVVAGAGEYLSPKCARYYRVLAERSARSATAGQAAAFRCWRRRSTPARGAAIYGEILGAGVASEPQAVSVPWSVDPEGRALELAMRAALADSGFTKDDITDISLAAGDGRSGAFEMTAIERIFCERTPELSVARSKRLFGEALGASRGCLLATLAELRVRARGRRWSTRSRWEGR